MTMVLPSVLKYALPAVGVIALGGSSYYFIHQPEPIVQEQVAVENTEVEGEQEIAPDNVVVSTDNQIVAKTPEKAEETAVESPKKEEPSSPPPSFWQNIVRAFIPEPSPAPQQSYQAIVSEPAPSTTTPTVTEFRSSVSAADLGDSVTLTWASENTTTCAITETDNVSIPFVGRLPQGSTTFKLAETTHHKRPVFKYYAICADKDWHTDTRELSINILSARFTGTPAILSAELNNPDAVNRSWRIIFDVPYIGADQINYSCQAQGMGAEGRIAASQKTSRFSFQAPENGLHWGAQYDCIFHLKTDGVIDTSESREISFTTPTKPE